MLLEGLRAKEEELTRKLEPVSEQYYLLRAELKTLQHGIKLLTRQVSPGRLPIPDCILDDAERQHAEGKKWDQVAEQIGKSRSALIKAVYRRSRGNPQRKSGKARLMKESGTH